MSKEKKRKRLILFLCFCNAQSGIDFSPTLRKQISLKSIPVIGSTWQMNCFLYSLLLISHQFLSVLLF